VVVSFLVFCGRVAQLRRIGPRRMMKFADSNFKIALGLVSFTYGLLLTVAAVIRLIQPMASKDWSGVFEVGCFGITYLALGGVACLRIEPSCVNNSNQRVTSTHDIGRRFLHWISTSCVACFAVWLYSRSLTLILAGAFLFWSIVNLLIDAW